MSSATSLAASSTSEAALSAASPTSEAALSAVSATVLNAGVASKRVMWQGIGHGASIYSPCAVPPLIGYLNSGKLPGTDTYCPA